MSIKLRLIQSRFKIFLIQEWPERNEGPDQTLCSELMFKRLIPGHFKQVNNEEHEQNAVDEADDADGHGHIPDIFQRHGYEQQ